MSVPEKVRAASEEKLPGPYEDLRQWLEIVESMGELKRINNADWDLEIGTLAELIYRERPGVDPEEGWLNLGTYRTMVRARP